MPDPVPTESPTISPTPTSYDFGPQVPTQLCGPTGPTGGAPVPGLTLAMQLTSSPEGEFGLGWNVRLVVRNTTDHDVAFYPAGADRIDLGQVLRPGRGHGPGRQRQL